MSAGASAPARETRRPPAGFTLVELVMVIAIIGTLAIFVAPRALDMTAWRLRAFGDELTSQMQAMQRLALVQRRPVVATLDTTGVVFGYASGGTLATVACPPTVTPCIAESGPRTVTFNASNSGRAVTSTGSRMTVTVSASGTSQAYVVETETGLFRPAP